MYFILPHAIHMVTASWVGSLTQGNLKAVVGAYLVHKNILLRLNKGEIPDIVV